jgi:spore maturation protein CgeB
MRMKMIALCNYHGAHVELAQTLTRLDVAVLPFRDDTELGDLVRDHARPDSVWVLNYHEPIHRVCRENGLTYVMWSMDSGMKDRIRPESLRESDFLFFFNEEDAAEVSKFHAGTHFLPFSAGDSLIRAPSPRCKHDILFAMNSFRSTIENSEREFARRIASLSDPNEKRNVTRFKEVMDASVEKHLGIVSENRMPALVTAQFVESGCGDPFHGDRKRMDYFLNAYCQILSARQRETLLDKLLSETLSVTVVGDGWKEFLMTRNETTAVDLHAPVSVPELVQFYNESKITLNLTQMGNLASVPQRIFHALASGAFILANDYAALTRLFSPGIHLETFSDFREMHEKIRYYLDHEDQRRTIAEEGHREFLAHHRMTERIRTILRTIRKKIK